MSAVLHVRPGASLAPRDAASPLLADGYNIAALQTACGTFGAVCISFFLFAFLVQVALAARRLSTCGGAAGAAGAAADSSPERILHGVRHLGIIMDGNRRYGRRHSVAAKDPDAGMLRAMREELCSTAATAGAGDGASWLASRFTEAIRNTAFDGHRLGGEKLLDVVMHCMEEGIGMVTVYAFSTDNWRRPAAEVDALLSLFVLFFDRVRTVALDQHIFVRFVVTDSSRLPPRVLELMRSVECETRAVQPRRLVLNICVSYSGQSEIVAACNRIVARRLHESRSPATATSATAAAVTKAELDREMLRSITQDEHEAEDARVFGDGDSGASVEPDLILRTSGEQRLSNFLLYECAYSELLFLDATWPEVTRQDIRAALANFSHREKRHGQ
ncbi:cis-prenyltransferase-like protein [Novymonas esmeraldas]|uniref:Cis-prenyltransferase-like protein n=1 Tax=Novymonas esmeraldas TaxID=1808958 RepID=A0AAW0F1G1_9TRYP